MIIGYIHFYFWLSKHLLSFEYFGCWGLFTIFNDGVSWKISYFIVIQIIEPALPYFPLFHFLLIVFLRFFCLLIRK